MATTTASMVKAAMAAIAAGTGNQGPAPRAGYPLAAQPATTPYPAIAATTGHKALVLGYGGHSMAAMRASTGLSNGALNVVGMWAGLYSGPGAMAAALPATGANIAALYNGYGISWAWCMAACTPVPLSTPYTALGYGALQALYRAGLGIATTAQRCGKGGRVPLKGAGGQALVAGPAKATGTVLAAGVPTMPTKAAQAIAAAQARNDKAAQAAKAAK